MKNINLTKWRYVSSAISILLMITSLAIIGVKGFNWGLDFTGGVVTEVQLDRKSPAVSYNLCLTLPISRKSL